MFYPLSLYIGLRYTRSKRSQFVSFVSLFSTGGILLGVMALITVLSVMNGLEQEQKERVLGAVPHVIYTNEKEQVSNWRELLPSFESLPHVQAVSGVVFGEAMAQSPGQLQGVLIQGIYPEYHPDDIIRRSMLVGDLNELEAGKYKVIIGRSLARQLGVTLGDKVRLMSAKGTVFTPFGRLPSQRNFVVAGLFEVSALVDSTQVLVHGDDAARLMRKKKGAVSGIRFYLDDPFNVSEFEQVPPAAGFTYLDWRESHGDLFQAVRMEKNMIWLLLSLIVVVAAFNILSASVLLVSDKEGEVAILKTLGIKNETLLGIFIIQGALSGIIGAIVGTVLGLILSLNINPVLSAIGLNVYAQVSGKDMSVVFDYGQIAAIVGGAVLLSLLATLYPAWRASQVKPAEALRYE